MRQEIRSHTLWKISGAQDLSFLRIRAVASRVRAMGLNVAIPDMWKLASSVEENQELWWSSTCGVQGCDYRAWQLDSRGYRCYEHRFGN